MHDVLLFQRSTINHNSLNQWVERINEQLHRFGVRTHFIDLMSDQKEMAVNGQRKAKESLSWNSTGEQLYEILKIVIDK